MRQSNSEIRTGTPWSTPTLSRLPARGARVNNGGCGEGQSGKAGKIYASL